MKLSVQVKSLTLPLILFFSILIFFSAKAYPSSADGHQSLELYFNLENGGLNLKDVVLIPSITPKSTYLKDAYKIEILSQDDKKLYQTYFRDPGIVYYDLLDSTTQSLSGGMILKDHKLFKIRIPYLAKAKKLSIFDPTGTEKFHTDLDQLFLQVRKISPYPVWEVDTLIYNGDPSNRIDIIFLGDGYTIDDTGIYSNDVQRFTNFMFGTVSPYKEYSTYFNVYKVKVISQERGSDHLERNPPVYVNTALGTFYGCGGIDRLICAEDESVYYAAQSVPWYDEIAILVNDPTYGGGGGDYLTTYNGYWGEYTMVHELGHSFANLADEYLYGYPYGVVSGCNCARRADHPGWQSWIDIGSPGVGVFAGCSYGNLYRPTYDACMMKALMSIYCVVCREQTIRSIYQRVRGYDEFIPSVDTLSIDTLAVQTFEVMTLHPNTHSLAVNWFVNDELTSSDNPFDYFGSIAGIFYVKGVVYDSTDMVIDDPSNLLVDSMKWEVKVAPWSYICGDPNKDSKVTVSDVIFLVNYLFKGGSAPIPQASADANLDYKVTVSDVVYLVNYLFKGGPKPCS
jgi:hypothetical protein